MNAFAESPGKALSPVAPRLRLVLCLATVGVALLSLLGTALGRPLLAALGEGLVPMSPLASGQVLLLAGAMLLMAFGTSSASRRWLACTLAALVAGLALGFVAGHVHGDTLALQRLLLRRWPHLQLPSLLTDVSLLAAALAFLVRWQPIRATWARRQVSALLTLLPQGIGGVVLISYAAGAPLLYGSGFIPMALPSALCALGLGLALQLAAGEDVWPLVAFRRGEGQGRPWSLFGIPAGATTLFLAIGSLILVGGAWAMRLQVRSAREQVQGELKTIGTLKARQIVTWHQERLADAEVIAKGALLQTQLRHYLAGARQAPDAAVLQAWMATLVEAYSYRRVVLFDAKGQVRLAVPALDAASVTVEDETELRAALRSTTVLVRDLHQAPGQSNAHMGLWIPVGGAAGGSGNAGTLLLMIDPRPFLYPLVSTWPVESATAETVLVRREGQNILYLSDLRHRPGSAMVLQASLAANPDMPAVQAVQGREGVVEGRDYRGVPVLAVVHPIPGTDWHMVSKVDAAEVYGPLRQRIWVGGLGLLGGLMLVGAVLGMMLRQHDAGMVRQQLHLAQRFEWLMREANDVIFLLDAEGRILEANAQAVERYGYKLAELVGKDVIELRVPEVRAEGRHRYEHLKAVGAVRFESIHQRKDGSSFPVEVSAKAHLLDGELRVISFVRDITERRTHEQALQRMTQLYSAHSQVYQAIVLSPDRQALFDKLCEVMVQFGGFDLAWIGLNDPRTRRVAVVASQGDTLGYLDRIQIESGDSPLSHGPVGTAIREGCPCIVNDFLAAPESGPWQAQALVSGFQSVGAFPIHQDHQVVGAFTVYSKEKDFFGPREAELLMEAALDISFALDHLAGEEQRRQTEIALLESERMLKEAQEAGAIGSYTWFIQQDLWKSSPFLDQIFGIAPEYPRNLAGWTGIIDPDFRDEMQAYVAGIIARREPFDLDYPIVRPADGARRWVHGKGVVHRDGEDRPVALVGIIQDITERKLAEETLRQNEELFSKIFKAAPEAIFIASLEDGTFVEVNDVFLGLVGLSKEQVIGRTSTDLKVWVNLNHRQTYVQALMAHGSVRNFETQFWMGDGKIHDCLVSSEVIQLHGMACSLSFIWDITDRKLAMRSIRRLSMAMEQSPLSIMITDPQAIIEYVNPAFTKVTGYTREEALGRNPRFLKSPATPPEQWRAIWKQLKEGTVWQGEFENLRKSGEPFFERATIAPVHDEDGSLMGYIGIKADVTEQKRERAERRALEAQLHQSQKLESLGSLAGGVAHDMNNVLGAILGLASTLREMAEPFSPSVKSLDTIMSACMRGRGVVKSLLYFAHKDLQEECDLSLNDLVREMSQLLSHTTLQRIELSLDLQEGLGLLRGDPGALSHALMNLAVNALDAMPERGTLRIRTEAEPDGGLLLSVIDTGQGMSGEVLAKAMEPFFTTKPLGKGTGLGLAMVYGTLKAHDGTFDLTSQPGAGTTALLRFPASRVAAPGIAPASAPMHEQSSQEALRILLVDDDELIRESIGPLLEMLGHTVTLASGGAPALRLLEDGLQVDLVILDMNMPVMSGAKALPRILELRPNLPVIMATGYSEEEITPLLAGCPSVTSLRKPFSLKEVQHKIAGLYIQPIVAPRS